MNGIIFFLICLLGACSSEPLPPEWVQYDAAIDAAPVDAQSNHAYCATLAIRTDVNCNGVFRSMEPGNCIDSDIYPGCVSDGQISRPWRPCDDYIDGDQDGIGDCAFGLAVDSDNDCWGDVCDNCPSVFNPQQDIICFI